MKLGSIYQGTLTAKTQEFGPHALLEKPLLDKKIGVWCAILMSSNIGPIFFEETINSTQYISHILEPFFLELTFEERQTGWFQQDDATAHKARVSIQAVQQVFSDRDITHGEWPPRSPDLTSPDFYLLVKQKGGVYANNPHTIELKDNIRAAICNVKREKLAQLLNNMRRRAKLCLEVNGKLFQQLM